MRLTEFKKWRQYADANGFITHVERITTTGKTGRQHRYIGYVNGEVICVYKTRASVYRRLRKTFVLTTIEKLLNR